MSFNQQSILGFCHDYETTGVQVMELGVIQSALCFATLHQDGSFEILEKDVQLLNPGMPIEPGATAIHGFTDFDVADKAPWFEYLSQQMVTVNSSNVKATIGFNSARFDNKIAMRAGWIPTPSFDLYKAASKFKKDHGWEKANLGYSYERLMGKPLEGAHDAFNDILATLQMVQPAMKLAGFSNIDDFHIWMQGADGTPDMTISWGKHKGKKIRHIPEDYLRWMLSSKCDMTLTHEMEQAVRTTLGIK